MNDSCVLVREIGLESRKAVSDGEAYACIAPKTPDSTHQSSFPSQYPSGQNVGNLENLGNRLVDAFYRGCRILVICQDFFLELAKS